MIISAPIFEAYLKCPSKYWLLFLGEKGDANIYTAFALVPWDEFKRIRPLLDGDKVRSIGIPQAVVWGTVKDHNGYINVESEEGEGSTFTLYFPASREDISSEAVAVSISEYMGKGESILIVDDIKGQRDLAATMLNSTTTAATSETKSSYTLPLFFLAIFALPMINKKQVEERL